MLLEVVFTLYLPIEFPPADKQFLSIFFREPFEAVESSSSEVITTVQQRSYKIRTTHQVPFTTNGIEQYPKPSHNLEKSSESSPGHQPKYQLIETTDLAPETFLRISEEAIQPGLICHISEYSIWLQIPLCDQIAFVYYDYAILERPSRVPTTSVQSTNLD